MEGEGRNASGEGDAFPPRRKGERKEGNQINRESPENKKRGAKWDYKKRETVLNALMA